MPRGAMRTRIGRAAALVVPSLWYEGLPMVVAEAFAAGTPVIASRIGALAHLVEDGVTGLLVAPGDPAALAEAIERL
ncbi:glycosyltransferase, partial [Acinetobacter baumannii]